MSFDINPIRQARSVDPRAGNARTADTPRDGTHTSAAARDPGVLVQTETAPADAGAPIDAERVNAIRAALAEGTYPLRPAKIADAMIAAKFMLSFS